APGVQAAGRRGRAGAGAPGRPCTALAGRDPGAGGAWGRATSGRARRGACSSCWPPRGGYRSAWPHLAAGPLHLALPPVRLEVRLCDLGFRLKVRLEVRLNRLELRLKLELVEPVDSLH